MDVLHAIMNRRSIRSYLRKPVEFDKLTMLLKAGSMAPSAGNLQSYRFIVITDKKVIKGVADHCTEQFWIGMAPILIVVVADVERTESYYGLRGQRLYAVQDCAAAIQNILLAAHDMGLGACWVGSFDEGYIADKLGIPEGKRPQAVITVGYAADSPLDKESCELDSLVSFNKFGVPVENMNLLVREYNKEIEKIVKLSDPAVDDVFKKLSESTKKIVSGAKSVLNKAKNRENLDED
ncbi:nitroreductase family protein [Candidatus Woesearchaeota archaeon]|nr:nitroreductase family protein [Candidatus Woesearchaeota archaeon]